ncbi:MAG TPA: patatin-like phospholipase family protein [Thermoanaerobaculia bacterium]|nr:patatin-like phospholipase family protein [Thermoanaerobaculia bacterium]
MTAPLERPPGWRPAPEPRRRTALVLSGGGAKGAYEVGVMRALFAGEVSSTGGVPLTADVFTGASVGGYNAVFLASQGAIPGAEANARLEQVWRTQIADTPASCGNGVFRWRADPLQYLSPGCLSTPLQNFAELANDAAFWARYVVTRSAQFLRSTESLEVRLLQSVDFGALVTWEPFLRLVPATIDFAALGASPKEVVAIACNWREGTVRPFDREAIAETYREQAVLASAAIPGLFPPVVIEDTPYVDGATLANTPMAPAIRLGANELHVIYLDPLVRNVPFPTLPETLATVYRLYVILVASNFRGDIATALQINRELGQEGPAGRVTAGRRGRGGAARLSRVAERARRGRAYRQLTIHTYRPREDLGGVLGLLDFGAQNIDYLIEQGYRDALAHDCEKELCVLPEKE